MEREVAAGEADYHETFEQAGGKAVLSFYNPFSTHVNKPLEMIPSDFKRNAIRHRVAKLSRNAKPASEILKLVLIGASNSGKTSLLLRFSEQRFAGDDASSASSGGSGQGCNYHQNTVGVDFKMKALEIDRTHVAKVQIWDTAGQERFRSISQAYFRNAHGCLAVYDVTKRASFEAIQDYVESFINYAPVDAAQNIILIGNKTDLATSSHLHQHSSRRQVSTEEALRLAKELGLAACLETSAKDPS